MEKPQNDKPVAQTTEGTTLQVIEGKELKKITGGAAAPTIEEIALMSGGHRKFG